MKTYKRSYASGGSSGSTRSKTYSPDNYKPLGDNGENFYNQGWFMDSDPVKGVYSYKNSMPSYNDVALKDGSKGYLGVTMNSNGLFDLDIKDNTGKSIQNIFKGGNYKDLNTYMTNDKSLVSQRNNRVVKTVPAKTTNKLGLIGSDPDILGNTASNKMATGGQTSSGSGMDWSSIANEAPDVLNSIMSLFDNHTYSSQPIINPSAARTMISPYAMGGISDSLGLSDDDIQQLQDEADSQGISVDELIQQMQDAGQDNTDNDGDTNDNSQDTGDNYAMGGFKTNPKHKGWCTPMSKSTCTGKRRQFAINAKNHFKKHAFGGATASPINVEGKEIVEPPGGMPMKMAGPSHENGGIDMNVPDGTKIFSKRLKLDGKTMAQRKIARERRANKLNKLLDNNPTNKLLRNTHSRTLENLTAEENKDMAIQTIANHIYSAPQEHGFGGNTGVDIPRTGAWWEEGEDYPTAPVDLTTAPNYGVLINKGIGQEQLPDAYPDNSRMPLLGFRPTIVDKSNGTVSGSTTNTPLTSGDIVGMAGEVFNGIAPLINSRNAQRNTKPAVNRYQDFGHDAIEANDSAQSLLATTKTDEQRDLDTDYNTSVARNNSNATSVNTSRAMNTAADIIRSRGRSSSNSNYVRNQVALLQQRGALTNARDQYRDYGQTQADLENQAMTDNYFTNHGQDLVNLGNSVEGIGSNLNTSHSNSVDNELLSQLSQYGLGLDKNGKLITVGR